MDKKIYELFNVRRRENKHIGIEIEMEGENLPIGFSKFWDVTGDGSLRGTSREFVLKAPCHKNKTKSRLDFLQQELKEMNAKLLPSDRCGVHIHVNCQDLTVTQVINFAVLYLVFEEILVKWCGENREGNLFCLRASDAEMLIQEIVICRMRGNLNSLQNDKYRYASINLSAIRKFGSVEFRAMGTPKKFASIQLWIDMLLRVQEASLGYKEPHEIVEDLSVTGGLMYVRKVFGPLYKHLVCPELNRICIDGVRRVQQIAYTKLDEVQLEAQKINHWINLAMNERPDEIHRYQRIEIRDE